jgi:hypothetical protein
MMEPKEIADHEDLKNPIVLGSVGAFHCGDLART